MFGGTITAKYHMRRSEREIKGEKKLLAVLRRGKHMTIAMCKEGEPYLVTVNHSLDEKARCLYFHCAQNGKKVDFLRSNPSVWGQVIEDMGYIQGECDYSYRAVMFGGKAEFVSDSREKRRALILLIDKLDEHPEATKRRFMVPSALQGVAVCRIQIESMTGKESSPP